jgi:predicted porin
MYDTNWWSVHAAYDSLRGGPGAFSGLTSSSLKDDRLSLGGYVLTGKAKAGLGWIARRNEALATARSDLFYAGVAYDVTPTVNVAGEGYYLKYRNSADKAWLGAVRASYAFSKRTSVYATAGYIANGGQLALSVSSAGTGTAPAAGGGQFGSMVGIKHIF